MNFGFTFVRISHEELERYVAACAAASLISPTPTRIMQHRWYVPPMVAWRLPHDA